jgi:hypothetical protein
LRKKNKKKKKKKKKKNQSPSARFLLLIGLFMLLEARLSAIRYCSAITLYHFLCRQ